MTRPFKFRDARDGSTFTVDARDEAEAIVLAQSQHDQAEADKRRALRKGLDNPETIA